MATEGADVMLTGKLFQALVAAATNARSPTVLRRVLGVSRSTDFDERRCRPGASATRCSCSAK
jgi:hypothetical protein